MKSQDIIKLNLLMALFLSIFVVSSAQTEQKRPLPQYVFEKFAKGVVKMKNGTKYTAILNYNTVDEEMVFEQQGTYMVVANPQEIDTVYLQNRIFIPMEKGFYELAAAGKYNFFIQHKGRYTEVATNTAYGMKTSNTNPITVVGMTRGSQYRSIEVPESTSVTDLSTNYVSKDNKMEKFNNTNQLLKIFPDKSNELKKYIKENDLDLKKYEDLVKIGKYCNEIMN